MDLSSDGENRESARIFWYPVLLWVVLLLVVFSYFMLNDYGSRKAREGLPDSLYEERVSPELMLMGRYCMGAKSVYGNLPGLRSSVIQAQLLQQLKKTVRLKTDQVSLIAFVAEFANPEEIFQYINKLRNDPGLSSALAADLDQFEILYQSGADALSADVHQQLIKRYRWIAQMALTFGLPADNPQRELAMKSAVRTFIASFVLIGALFIGGISGLVLFIVFLVKYAKKRIRFAIDLERPGVPLRSYVYLETTLLFLAMVLLLSFLSSYVPPLVYWCLYLFVAVAALLWPVWRGMPFGMVRRAIGWHKGKGVMREIGAGLLGYLGGLPLVVGAFLVTFYIVKHTDANPVHPIVYWFENAAGFKMVGLVALASIVAPIVEETIFRGALYRYIRFKHSAALSVVTTGLLFALVHPQGLAAIPALGAIGAVFAILREWRGSLIAPMVAHAFNNFVVTMMLVFTFAGS